MPLEILMVSPGKPIIRLIKASLNKSSDTLLVVPFVGSGSECVSAKKNNVNFIGFEINGDYINTANKLPVFPFALDDLKQNPYLTVLIDDVELLKDNVYGFTYKENYDGYGVCDLETFKKRFNMFTSEDPNCDPLKGLDWTKFAVSGSSVTACLQKRSQLLDEMVKQNNNDETLGFVKFVRKYYGESDIDLMSNQTNFIEFLNSVQTVSFFVDTLHRFSQQ
jgi:hypothetical protein